MKKNQKKMTKIDHIAFIVENIDEACKFYSEKLKLHVQFKYQDWALLKNDNITLALTLKGKHPYHIAVKCETLDLVEEKGVPDKHRDGSISYYEDDGSGNAIEWIYYPSKKM